MKTIINKLTEIFNWLASDKVLDAINDGKTYEEVCAIAKGEIR